MKKQILKISLIIMLAAGMAVTGNAQRYYVKVRPTVTVAVRPAAPSNRHVWVEGDWVWRSNAYVWQAGYWAMPPRANDAWIPGHWVRSRRGSYWIAGHWRY